MKNTRKNLAFNPIKRAATCAPTPAEVERITIQTIGDLASIGAAKAIPILVNTLGCFLWSEHVSSCGPKFDGFMTAIENRLRQQIELLEAGTAGQAVHATEGSHVVH